MDKMKEELDSRLEEKIEYVEYKFKNSRDASSAKSYFDGIQLMNFDVNDDNISNGELMVDAGMSPKDAILSATLFAADLLGEKENLGSIEPGKYADIVAVSSDPLEDIKVLETIDFVMKGGEVIKQP